MSFDVKISFSSNRTDHLRFAFYATAAPTALVLAIDETSGNYLPSIQIVATLPQRLMYMMRVYVIQPDNSNGEVLHEVEIDPSITTVNVYDTIEIVVGRGYTDPDTGAVDPAAGDTSCIITSLANKEIDWISEVGVGDLPNVQWNNRTAGGFDLAIGTFQLNDTYKIHPKIEKVTYIPQPSVLGAEFNDAQIITSNTTLDSTYLKQLLLLESNVVITLDALANVPDNSFIGFSTPYGTTNKQSTIQCNGTDKIRFFDGFTGQLSAYYMGMNEFVKFYKKGSYWYLLGDTSFIERIGQPFWGYAGTPNSLVADGTEYLRADYPRAYYFLNELVTLNNGFVSDGTWNGAGDTNKAQWSTGSTTAKFRVPDLRGLYLRGLDKGRGLDTRRVNAGKQNTIGSYFADTIKDHQHETTIGTLITSLFGKGLSIRYKGTYQGTANGQTDLTGTPVDAGGNAIGGENTVKDAGLLILIRI